MAITPEEAKEKYTRYILEKYNKCEASIDKYLSNHYYVIAKNGQIKMEEKTIKSQANMGSYSFENSWAEPVIQAILEKFKDWGTTYSKNNHEFTFYLKGVERTVVKADNVYQFLDLGDEMEKKPNPKKARQKKVKPNLDTEDDEDAEEDFDFDW